MSFTNEISSFIDKIYTEYGIISAVGLLIIVGLLLWAWNIVYEGILKPIWKKQADNIKNKLKKKHLNTIHIFLPLTGNAKGDGLMQAAGFMKASKDFKNLKIVLHDTNYDASRAVNKMCALMKDWEKKDGPLAIIVTMSHTCLEMANKAKELLNKKEYKSLKKSFSMILTVASASRVPHMPELGIYKYTVSGDKEVEYIKHNILNNPSENNFNLNEPMLLCSSSSDYPTSSISELVRKIIKHEVTPPFAILPFNENGELPINNFINISDYKQAIVFGYDKYLFKMFKVLIENNFKGKVLCPTTFSVKDWQQIWQTIESHDKLQKLDYYYLDICDIEHQNVVVSFDDLIDFIVEHLDEDSSMTVNQYRRNFDEKERASYEIIDKNYISNFCYDSIRLFDMQHQKGLKQFNFSKLESNLNGANKIPLGILSESPRGLWTNNGFEMKQYER